METQDLTGVDKKEEERTRIAKQAFLEAFQKSRGVVSVCCDSVGISRQTYYNWMSDDADFATALRQVTAKRNDEIEDILIGKALIQKDGPSVRFYLERKHPDYKQKSKVEHFIPDGRSLEDLLDAEAKQHDTTKNESGSDTGTPQDTEQAAGDGTLPPESGAGVVLEKKDPS